MKLRTRIRGEEKKPQYKCPDSIFFISGAEILPQYKSDHSPVQINTSIYEQTRGRGYWTFNNSLLKNEKFVKIIKEEIVAIKRQYAATSYNSEYIPNKS